MATESLNRFNLCVAIINPSIHVVFCNYCYGIWCHLCNHLGHHQCLGMHVLSSEVVLLD